MLGFDSLQNFVVHEFYSSFELADVDSLHNKIHLAALILKVALDQLIALSPFSPLVLYLFVFILHLLTDLLLALIKFTANRSNSLCCAIFGFL